MSTTTAKKRVFFSDVTARQPIKERNSTGSAARSANSDSAQHEGAFSGKRLCSSKTSPQETTSSPSFRLAAGKSSKYLVKAGDEVSRKSDSQDFLKKRLELNMRETRQRAAKTVVVSEESRARRKRKKKDTPAENGSQAGAGDDNMEIDEENLQQDGEDGDSPNKIRKVQFDDEDHSHPGTPKDYEEDIEMNEEEEDPVPLADRESEDLLGYMYKSIGRTEGESINLSRNQKPPPLERSEGLRQYSAHMSDERISRRSIRSHRIVEDSETGPPKQNYVGSNHSMSNAGYAKGPPCSPPKQYECLLNVPRLNRIVEREKKKEYSTGQTVVKKGPVSPQPRKGWLSKFLLVCLALLILAALVAVLPFVERVRRSKNQTDINFDVQILELESSFPSQRKELWRRSRIHMEKHLQSEEPTEPVSMILTAGRKAERTLHCLASGLARAYSSALNASALHIDGLSKAALDSDRVKLEIDEELTAAFEGNKRAAVIHRFEELPPDSTLIFYKYCDHENAAYKAVSLIFTVLLEEDELGTEQTLGSVEEKVRDYIENKFLSSHHPSTFNEMDTDKFGGLWSRISHLVVPVTAEDGTEKQSCDSYKEPS